MSEALTRLLHDRHPDLFALRHEALVESALASRGFEHEDGWLGSLRLAAESSRGCRLACVGLVGDTAPVGDDVLGATASLAALGRRVDRRTGAVGPVDDQGRLVIPPPRITES